MTHELGKELHAVRMTYAWRIFVLLPLLGFAVIVAVVFKTAKNPPKTDEIIGVSVTAFALIVPVILVWRWHAKIWVRVYEQGIVRESGSRQTVIKWGELLFVRYRAIRQKIHGISVGTNHYVTLVGIDKRKIKLSNNLKNGAQLINFVLNRILEEQIPKFLSLIQQGHEVPFGKISISQDGLKVKSKRARWDSISDVALVNGRVKVRLANKWLSFYSTQFSEIPNGHAFIQLCQQFLSKKPLSASANLTEIISH